MRLLKKKKKLLLMAQSFRRCRKFFHYAFSDMVENFKPLILIRPEPVSATHNPSTIINID